LEPVVSEEPFAFTDDVDCVREDELRRDEVVNCGVPMTRLTRSSAT
jgi:hypothetical protein